jgi:quercetin dioxygenase-like cupin family protein
MTIHRPGLSIQRTPACISSAPFWAEMLLESSQEGENTVMRATLDPGVVTHWHTHPRGQVLYVLSGAGLVQRDGNAAYKERGDPCN